MPPEVPFEALSPNLQAALRDIINPAYQELVLAAATAFERSAAVTYVHVAWLELRAMIEFGLALETARPGAAGAEGYQEGVAQYLRLVATKDKAGKFLLELQRFAAKLCEIDALHRVPR
jgi:hypothetical protein